MKALLNFPDSSEYNSFYNNVPISDIGGSYYKPNVVSFCKTNKEIHYNKKEHIIPIEYLQSNGTQYIDTKIIPNANTGAYIKVICSDNTDRYFIGLRNNASTNTRWGIGHSSAGFYWCYNTYQSSNRLTGSSGELWLNFNNSKKFVATWNNTTKEDSLPSISFTPQYSIWLFGWNGSTRGYWAGGKIYFAQISQGIDLIMDLIPVRKGTIGYMYDKLSGQLFGNSGSGSFILGPDL